VKCILGLGNPGKKYAKTRHNIGFMCLDYLATKIQIPFVPGKGDYYILKTQFLKQDVLLVKPTTFVNLSGDALAQVCESFQLEKSQVLVVCDDYNLPFGSIRFREKGSAGGHNGLKSVIYNLESEDIPRLRLGIGDSFEDAIDFVLDDFDSEEYKKLDDVFNVAEQGIEKWIIDGIDSAMNSYNGNIFN